MTWGYCPETGVTTFTLSREETENLKSGEPIKKVTIAANEKAVVTLQLETTHWSRSEAEMLSMEPVETYNLICDDAFCGARLQRYWSDRTAEDFHHYRLKVACPVCDRNNMVLENGHYPCERVEAEKC